MKIEEAHKLVQKEIETLDGDFSVMKEETKEYEKCFVIYYQTKKYIETKQLVYMSIGNGPVFVSKESKKVFRTGSAFPEEVYLKSFNTHGDPFKGIELHVEDESTIKLTLTPTGKGFSKLKVIQLLRELEDTSMQEAKSKVEKLQSNKTLKIEICREKDIESLTNTFSKLEIKVTKDN